MGGGGKGGTSTSTVSIPPEVLARYNAVNARAEEVAKKPFEAYTGEFVSPINEEQTQGISQTQKYSEAAQPYYARAAGMTEDAYNASQPLTASQIQQYQNPYIQSVVDPTLKALQQQQAIDRQGQTAQAIKSGAFGGERAGLQRAVTTGQQELAQAQAISPLYASAYQNALATAQQQQQQRVASGLQAGQQTAGIGTTAQQAGLQGGQAVIGAGTLKQQTGQALDTAKYQQFLQERGYDFQTAQFLANIAEGTGALSGSTTTSTQPTSFFSDERLKHDIKKIGKTNDGQPIYSFKYNGDDRTQIGLLAQEVEKKHPEAVGLSGGYKTVDYAKATAGARHARAMGGLVPESMGGAVFEPGNFARGGYVGGGLVTDPNDIAAILAAQSKSFGPFAKGGLYGGSSQQDPHGAAPGYVPKASLVVPKLVTSSFQPKSQQNELQSAMQNINAAGTAAKTLGAGYDWAENKYDKLTAKPKDPNATPDSNVAGPSDKTVSDTGRTVTIKPPASPSQMNPSAPKTTGFGTDEYIDPNLDPTAFAPTVAHGGGIMPRHHFADGGPEDSLQDDFTTPGLVKEDKVDGKENRANVPASGFPTDVLSSGQSAKELAVAKNPSTSGGQSGMSSLAQGLGAANNALKAGKSISTMLGGGADAISGGGTFAAGMGPFMSEAGIGAGAAEGAGLMGGIGSALGSIGEGIASVLPFIFLKDGGSVPHRASGGVVPRQGFANPSPSGAVEDPLAGYHPRDLAIRTIATEAPPDHAEEMAGVTAVVGNRLNSGQWGNDYKSVVTAKNQFEPWNNPNSPNYPLRVDPESDRYKKAAAALARWESEGYDPTGGAMHFWAPKAQTALGRQAPSWDNENALNIGTTRFVKVGDTGAPKQQAPQQQQQSYPLQDQIEGGFGKAKSIVNSMVPSDYKGRDVNAQGEQRGWGDFLTSRDFVLPLMAGLGTMASSPSRYLGAAILQGLGGAAQAYQGVQKQQADIDQTLAGTGLTKATTEGTNVSTAAGSIVSRDGQLMFLKRNPAGGFDVQRAFEYFKLPAQERAALGLSAADVEKLKVQAAKEGYTIGEDGTVKTEGGLKPPNVGTATPPPALGAPKVDEHALLVPPVPDSKILTDEEKAVVERNLTAAQAANGGKDHYTPQKLKGDAARNMQPLMRDLAVSMARLPETGSPNVPGPLAPFTTGATNVAGNLLRILGRDPSKLGVAETSDPQEIQKIIKNIAGDPQYQGNIHAHAILNDIAERFPTMINTREGQAKLMSSVMSLQRREIDKDDYNTALLQHANSIDPRMGSLSGYENNALFERRYGRLNEEPVLRKMFLTPMVIDGKKQIDLETKRPMSQMEFLYKNGNQLSPAERTAIENQLKAPRILRHFGL